MAACRWLCNLMRQHACINLVCRVLRVVFWSMPWLTVSLLNPYQWVLYNAPGTLCTHSFQYSCGALGLCFPWLLPAFTAQIVGSKELSLGSARQDLPWLVSQLLRHNSVQFSSVARLTHHLPACADSAEEAAEESLSGGASRGGRREGCAAGSWPPLGRAPWAVTVGPAVSSLRTQHVFIQPDANRLLPLKFKNFVFRLLMCICWGLPGRVTPGGGD